METTLIVPVILDKTATDSEIKEATKYTEQRDKLLNLGCTIKETRLVAFNHGVYAHYVIEGRKKDC